MDDQTPENDRPALRLITGNRMELLVDRLAAQAAHRHGDPFAKECVVVPNPGMARWLSMQLADRLGIWANAEFLFPDVFMRRLFQARHPELPQHSFFDPDSLTWSIMSLLGSESLAAPEFAPLTAYLSDGRLLKRYQFSSHIADALDQYTIYRSEMIFSWDKGAESDWQALLWRKLTSLTDERHRADLQREFLHSVSTIPSPMLPRRLAVFGISSLPPFHVAMLAALAARIPVCLYVLNPSAEFWDQIVSDEEASRIVRKSLRTGGNSAEELHLEAGNPLLAALGRHGRDFFAMLHNSDLEELSVTGEDFPETLLGMVQHDIFHLIDRGSPGSEPRLQVYPEDRSIEIHLCHSPQRETEALFDWLLDLFNEHPELGPSDVLVMTPDITTYAPFIRAVFDTPEKPALRIPYSLADLNSQSESLVVNSFLALLGLPLSRFEAGAVMDLLETPEIRNAFDIEEIDLPRLRAWVSESGIRWGLDSRTLAELDLPPDAGNTWEAGAERLLLGYAMSSSGKQTFANIAAFDAIEGADATLAGKLLDFVHHLADFADRCRLQHAPAAWISLLTALLDSCFVADRQATEPIRKIQEAVSSLAIAGRHATVALDLETVREYLKARLGRTGNGTPFLSGGVTFCAMMPMRSIPFKVICCIGMNDGAFPRKRFRQSWDLIAVNPRPGDRSLDREDRYLFLETLLSCRERLYISHIGRNLRDNAVIPPSVVVEDLLAAIDKGFCLQPGTEPGSSEKPVSSMLIVEHRLQKWNPAYFAGNRLFTYSGFPGPSSGFETTAPFFKSPLPAAEGELLSPTLANFIRFFRNPCRQLLAARLGMTFEKQEEQLDDSEPFVLSGLERYSAAKELAVGFLSGESPDSCFAYLKSQGKLPHGIAGQFDFETLSEEVNRFIEGPKRFLDQGKLLPATTFSGEVGPLLLSGVIDNCFDACRLAIGFTGPSAGDCIEAWIMHLLLNAFGASGYPRSTLLFGKNRTIRLDPVAEPLAILGRLAELYAAGMSSPLPFFPKSSYAFAGAVIDKNKDHFTAARSALAQWNGNDYADIPGEKEDACYRFCFGAGALWSDDGCEAREVALEIWKPFFEHMKELEL